MMFGISLTLIARQAAPVLSQLIQTLRSASSAACRLGQAATLSDAGLLKHSASGRQLPTAVVFR
jgi:hypothetical protein